MKIDLHCHSTASDGVLTPDKLVQRAHERGVRLLSLTDHDTVAGIAQARSKAQELGLQLVNGTELSCTWSGATIHVLGYDFSLHNNVLNELFEQMHEARWLHEAGWLRAKEIDRRLAKAGFPGCLEGAQQLQQREGMPPGRPHFANFMVHKGYARDHGQAFKKWLGAGKLGDVKQHWPELKQIMHCLAAADARISLAHPYQYNYTNSKRRRLVEEFKELGGHAIEVSNGMQPPDQVAVLGKMAKDFALKVTAGSDFHAPHQFTEIGSYRAPGKDLDCLWHDFILPEEFTLALGAQ